MALSSRIISYTLPSGRYWAKSLSAIPVASVSSSKHRTYHASSPLFSVHSPLGDTTALRKKKVTLQSLATLYQKKEPITMITAHDFPSAAVAEAAGVEMILVGDSLAMVALGMEDTSEVTLEEMIMHCRSVSRAARSSFLIGDLPMGSYEVSPEQGLSNAIRVMKEGRVNAVKLEGGKEMAKTVERITTMGIPVIGHVGMTPQRQHSLGGFRVQGKSIAGVMKVLEDALAIQDAGASLVVLEAIPAEASKYITEKLRIPTIGIGAGNMCSGQVLVQVDMNGNYPPGRHIPKFVKKYGDVWGESLKAIERYRDETKTRAYPAAEHTYPLGKDAPVDFAKQLEEARTRLIA